MNSSQRNHANWLYGVAFLIAVGFRFIKLGALPLTDSEASLALQALHLAQGKTQLLAPQPAYILFTSLFFMLIKSTNFMARIIPALAGSALIFVPYLFREKLKPRPALLLAFLFAIDPGLVALSREVNGTMLAATCLLFAWGVWMNRRVNAAGIFLGLALLSGPSVWSGIMVLALGSVFLRGILPKPVTDPKGTSDTESQSTDKEAFMAQYRGLLIPLFATLLLGGTLLFTVPNGLSATLAAIPAYLSGWVTASTMTAGRTLFTFISYELLGISIAFLSLIRGFRTNGKQVIRLGVWLGVALLLAVFYRRTSELIWAIIPLLALAALELSRAFDMERGEYVEVGLVVFAVVVLMAYTWFNLSGLALNPDETSATVPIFGVIARPRAFVLFGSLMIILVSLGLVAFGWSTRTARLGAVWSSVIFLGLYSVAAAWGASGMRDPGGVELWLPDSRPLQADLLLDSVNQISDLSVGHISSQPVTIFGITSPALEWLLRNNPVELVPTLDPQVAPPIVITPQMNDLSLPSAYRGQDFTWRQPPTWSVVQDSDWVKWLVFRELPVQNETIILWARNDLFPDARASNKP